jgi:type VI secretion system protein ImpL
MVWVTSALDGMPATENSATSGLTPDAMDSVSHALKLRYEALGWKLPLYVWSLHPRAGEQAGRVTQPVGCLLPANCSPQTLAGQLTGLIPQLTAQGIQQVCGQPQHNFLLALADQLTRKPETVTEPLSVLLNPYRPQPLAGVVFSAPSAEAGRSISHHWGRDNRWDILPDRMTELPAGLRPRKQGVNWMRGMSVATAALMLLWAASMTGLFYRQPRAGGDRTAAGAAGLGGKTAAGRTPACALRVTENAFSTGIPLAARRAVVCPRWPQSER